MSRQRDDRCEAVDLRARPWQQPFPDICHSLLHRLGVYPLGEDIPLYHASTIFPVLAQVPQVLQALPVLPVLQALPSPVLAQVPQVPQVSQVLPVPQVLPVLQALPSPVLALEVPIDCSQST